MSENLFEIKQKKITGDFSDRAKGLWEMLLELYAMLLVILVFQIGKDNYQSWCLN